MSNLTIKLNYNAGSLMDSQLIGNTNHPVERELNQYDEGINYPVEFELLSKDYLV